MRYRNFPYVRGKVAQACRVLATDPGNAANRVAEALRYLGHLQPEDFPTSFRAEYVAILKTANSHGRTRRSTTAARLARRIWDLHRELEEHYEVSTSPSNP
jgi:hypothetical protein